MKKKLLLSLVVLMTQTVWGSAKTTSAIPSSKLDTIKTSGDIAKLFNDSSIKPKVVTSTSTTGAPSAQLDYERKNIGDILAIVIESTRSGKNSDLKMLIAELEQIKYSKSKNVSELIQYMNGVIDYFYSNKDYLIKAFINNSTTNQQMMIDKADTIASFLWIIETTLFSYRDVFNQDFNDTFKQTFEKVINLTKVYMVLNDVVNDSPLEYGDIIPSTYKGVSVITSYISLLKKHMNTVNNTLNNLLIHQKATFTTFNNDPIIKQITSSKNNIIDTVIIYKNNSLVRDFIQEVNEKFDELINERREYLKNNKDERTKITANIMEAINIFSHDYLDRNSFDNYIKNCSNNLLSYNDDQQKNIYTKSIKKLIQDNNFMNIKKDLLLEIEINNTDFMNKKTTILEWADDYKTKAKIASGYFLNTQDQEFMNYDIDAIRNLTYRQFQGNKFHWPGIKKTRSTISNEQQNESVADSFINGAVKGMEFEQELANIKNLNLRPSIKPQSLGVKRQSQDDEDYGNDEGYDNSPENDQLRKLEQAMAYNKFFKEHSMSDVLKAQLQQKAFFALMSGIDNIGKTSLAGKKPVLKKHRTMQ